MYDALIRTFNSERCLPRTLDALMLQEVAPARIIVVDSGSADATCAIAGARGCIVTPYARRPFSYSGSLNLGFEAVQSAFCLVLSSHVIMTDPTVTRRLLAEVRRRETPAAYVNFLKGDAYREVIDAATFTGWNGLWNPCAMYRTEIVRQIGFGEHVPSAEDQWFASQLYRRGLGTVALGSSGVSYENLNVNLKKRRNEYVSVAYFSHSRLLGTVNILRIALRAMAFAACGDLGSAADRSILAMRLVGARIRRPTFDSRYF